MNILLDTLLMRRTRRMRRQTLGQLDAHLLRDIGLDGYSFNEIVTGRDITRLQDRRR